MFGHRMCFYVVHRAYTKRCVFMSLDKALGDKYSPCWCCSNTTALRSPTLPQLTRPGSDGDDTSLPHTTPSLVYDFHRWLHNQQGRERCWTPTHISSHRGRAHITQPPRSQSLSLQQNTAHSDTEIFPGFLSTDLRLTVSELREMSRSPVKGTVEISHNVSKWKPRVWLAVSGKWAGGRSLNYSREYNCLLQSFNQWQLTFCATSCRNLKTTRLQWRFVG